MSERSLVFYLLGGCVCYLIWIAWGAYSALSPQISSHGLTQIYPPPRRIEVNEGEVTLLDPRSGSLVDVLNQRYGLQLPPLSRGHTHPLNSLSSLGSWLKKHDIGVVIEPLTHMTRLPAIVERGRGELTVLTLLIARYQGEWVRFDPSRGVLLGPLPHSWLSSPALTSPVLREQRW